MRIPSILNDQSNIATQSLRFPYRRTCSICNHAQSQHSQQQRRHTFVQSLDESTGEFRNSACMFYRMSLFTKLLISHRPRATYCDTKEEAQKKADGGRSCESQGPTGLPSKVACLPPTARITQHAPHGPQSRKMALVLKWTFFDGCEWHVALLRVSVSHSPHEEAKSGTLCGGAFSQHTPSLHGDGGR